MASLCGQGQACRQMWHVVWRGVDSKLPKGVAWHDRVVLRGKPVLLMWHKCALFQAHRNHAHSLRHVQRVRASVKLQSLL